MSVSSSTEMQAPRSDRFQMGTVRFCFEGRKGATRAFFARLLKESGE
jgi:hypothetical protein